MSVYKTGQCTATPGSNLISFSSDADLSSIIAGYLWRFENEKVFYSIGSVDDTNKEIKLTGLYFNENYHALVSDEEIDEGDGGTSYECSITNTPIIPGTVSITDGVEIFTDDGFGILTGDQGGDGIISYGSGDVTLDFNLAVAISTSINATYKGGKPITMNAYQIMTGYTTNYDWPKLDYNTSKKENILRHAFRIIDRDLKNEDELKITLVTSNYTVSSEDNVIIADGELTITLQSASSRTKKLIIINKGSSTVTIQRAGTDTINYNSTSLTITSQYGIVVLVPYSTNKYYSAYAS